RASLCFSARGRGRGEIAAAIADQIGVLEAYSCFDPFTTGPADELAEKLVTLSPLPGCRVFYCDSGSESVDTAMKLARLAPVQAGHPERTVVITPNPGYHGTNYGGTSAQGIPPNKLGFGPLVPDVVQVPSDDIEALAT